MHAVLVNDVARFVVRGLALRTPGMGVSVAEALKHYVDSGGSIEVLGRRMDVLLLDEQWKTEAVEPRR